MAGIAKRGRGRGAIGALQPHALASSGTMLYNGRKWHRAASPGSIEGKDRL